MAQTHETIRVIDSVTLKYPEALFYKDQFDPEAFSVLEAASALRESQKNGIIDSRHIFLGFCAKANNQILEILARHELDQERVIEAFKQIGIREGSVSNQDSDQNQSVVALDLVASDALRKAVSLTDAFGEEKITQLTLFGGISSVRGFHTVGLEKLGVNQSVLYTETMHALAEPIRREKERNLWEGIVNSGKTVKRPKP